MKKTTKLIRTFKYLSIKRMFVRLKTLHERVKQLDENPYRLFLDWMLDNIQYGIVATTIAILISFYGWIGVGISFGMILWFYETILEKTKKIIKE